MIKSSLGIELTGSDLRVAFVRSAFGRFRLRHTATIAGFVAMSEDDRKSAIAKLVRKYRISSSRVFLSIPRDQGLVRQLEFPIEIREKLQQAIALQLETLSPWPVEDIYWDFVQGPVRKGGKSVDVMVAIIPRATVDPWIDFFRSVRLPLNGACLSSLTCAHGAASLWPDSRPTVLLDCEQNYVEGSLVEGFRLSSLTVPTSGDTENPSKTLVEKLLSLARVVPSEGVRLVVFGGNSVPVEEDRVRLPIEAVTPESTDAFVAIAAALFGLKASAFRANLVPRALRHRRSQLQLVPTYVLIVIAALLGAALLAREPYQSMLYADQIDVEIQNVAPKVQGLASQEAELNNLSEKYRALTKHLQNRDYDLEAMRELARVLPPSAWLASYSYQEGSITISGFAPAASEIQKLLEDSPLFREVQFTTSLSRDSSGKDRFTLKAAIEIPK